MTLGASSVATGTTRRRSSPTVFPYTTLFRSAIGAATRRELVALCPLMLVGGVAWVSVLATLTVAAQQASRSEEHTSELQSHRELVCRLVPEKKNSESLPFTDTAVAADALATP